MKQRKVELKSIKRWKDRQIEREEEYAQLHMQKEKNEKKNYESEDETKIERQRKDYIKHARERKKRKAKT